MDDRWRRCASRRKRRAAFHKIGSSLMGLLALLNRLFHGPPWLTFLAMGVAGGGLALCSFNLLFLSHANF
jgi:hypothetical protein